MNLINLKLSITVLTVTVTTFLAPKLAEAATLSGTSTGIIRFSGRPTFNPFLPEFTFDINPSAIRQGAGDYLNAIEKLNFKSNLINLNPIFCKSDTCPAGNLKISDLTPDKNSTITIAGQEFQINLLKNQIPNFNFYANDLLKAELTLEGNSIPTLVFLIDDNNYNLNNSLAKFSSINQNDIVTLSSEDFRDSENDIYIGGGYQEVPEPVMTNSWVILGVLGTLYKWQRQINKSR